MVIIDSSPSTPEVALDEQIVALAQTGAAERCFALAFSCRQHYLPGEPILPLLALVALRSDPEGVQIELAVLLSTPAIVEHLEPVPAQPSALKSFAESWGAPWLNIAAPLQLSPVSVAKPWGRELWYTGIEARGQSAVIAKGRKTPLPWLLALAPNRLLAGESRHPVLLKVLDPHAQSPYGDLYFEVHRHKREVYVVTHIDPQAWPGGVGGIRYGFNPQKRARYASDAQFKRDYLASVKAYEAVRRQIDEQLDRRRLAEGVELNEPVDLDTLRRWQAELDPEQNSAERLLRQAMESFTAVRPLSLGDSVRVSPLTPHSLLHGVRVVEFQTPSYEREILSFGQKVLNQAGWDTAGALEDIDLDLPPQHPPRRWSPSIGTLVEELVDFEDFAVLRVTLEAGRSVSLARLKCYLPGPKKADTYALVMGLEGSLGWSQVAGPSLRPEEAQLIPGLCDGGFLVSEQRGVFLLSAPRGQG